MSAALYEGQAPAFEAATKGDQQFFASLSSSELSRVCQRRDDDERTVLHLAAAGGHANLIELFVGAGGADVSVCDEDGWTPLISAASSGHDAVVDLLLNLGAKVDAANSSGRTALHYAASKGRDGVVSALLRKGASAAAKDSLGATPLHRAAGAGQLAAAEVLIRDGKAKVNVRDKHGETPLFLAAASGHQEVAFLLLRHGARLDIQNNEEQTAIDAVGDPDFKEKLQAALQLQEEPAAMEVG